MVEQVTHFTKAANEGKSISIDRLLFGLRFGIDSVPKIDPENAEKLKRFTPLQRAMLDAYMIPNVRGHYINDNTRAVFWPGLINGANGYSSIAYEVHMGHHESNKYWFRETVDGILAEVFAKPGETVTIKYKARGGRPGNRKSRRQGKG